MNLKVRLALISIIVLGFFLRTFQLSKIPPSLYWDEASLGYNAFAISQTLHDEHGEFLPLARFIAFGDYKAPGYIYADAVTVKLLGLSEFTVRFPSALSGTLLILITFYLLLELIRLGDWAKKINPNQASLLAAFLVAISPWTIQFSRGGFEANLATLLGAAGIYFLLKSLRTKSISLGLISALPTALSFYSFNSHRVFLPLFLLSLGLIFIDKFKIHWRTFLGFFIALVIIILPLMPHLTSREGKLRFYEVTWLNDLDPITLSVKRKAVDENDLISKIIHHKYVVFSGEFMKHYFDHLDPGFLFFEGDANPRLSIRTVGEFYLFDLVFLLGGLYFLMKFRGKGSLVIFSWLILSPIPAALAHETPHALRILNILPMPQIIVALGLAYLIKNISFDKKKISPFLIVVIYGFSFWSYLNNYYFDYPKKYALEWQYGYKQMVQYVTSVAEKYDHISITPTYGRPYIYFLFYQQYSPTKYFETRRASRDWFGLWNVYGFDKYVFSDDYRNDGKWLYVRAPNSKPLNSRIVKTIFDPNGRPVFEIWEHI